MDPAFPQNGAQEIQQGVISAEALELRPSLICLDDSYAYALIGRTVLPIGETRFCYSLEKLVNREMHNLRCTADEARSKVFQLVVEITMDHGDRAPLFIDDAISQEKVTLLGPCGAPVN